jgi:sodium/potassium-transporting ATPase subunit alpha
VPELIPYLALVLFKIPLPLTHVQLLAVDMGTDSLTALGLSVERPNPQVMPRPPRPQRERLLNWSVALRAYTFLGLIEAVASMAAFFFVLYGGGWK